MKETLFTPIRIGAVEYKNRFVMSPMCMYSAQNEDGKVTDWHLVHYTTRAIGGFGLIIQEATAVSPEGRISPDDLGIWSDAHCEGLEKLVKSIHQYGCKAGIQLAHAGRKASALSIWKGSHFIDEHQGGWPVVAPTAMAFNESAQVPSELDLEGIEKVINDFREAARRAVEVGYDTLEIHAAHGYLIHEFLSPITNKRTDDYGGSFDNRIRLLVDIVRAIRSEMTEKNNLFVRLSCVDYLENGWTIEDSVRLSQILKAEGVDLIDCSSGAIAPGEKINVGPLYQLPFAQKIKFEAGVSTGAVGLIESLEDAMQVIDNDQVDVVLLGRVALRDPYVVNNFYRQMKGEGHLLPPQYLRAFRK